MSCPFPKISVAQHGTAGPLGEGLGSQHPGHVGELGTGETLRMVETG